MGGRSTPLLGQGVGQKHLGWARDITAAKNYVMCHYTAEVVKLKMHALQLLNV